jgi:hypothetical protein
MWFGGPGASGFFGGYGYNGAPGQSEVIPMHDGILVGKGEAPQHLLCAMANRHGLIAGATGTCKTVSVRVLAESRRAACRCSWRM